MHAHRWAAVAFAVYALADVATLLSYVPQVPAGALSPSVFVPGLLGAAAAASLWFAHARSGRLAFAAVLFVRAVMELGHAREAIGWGATPAFLALALLYATALVMAAAGAAGWASSTRWGPATLAAGAGAAAFFLFIPFVAQLRVTGAPLPGHAAALALVIAYALVAGAAARPGGTTA